jgi:hypothetical protein
MTLDEIQAFLTSFAKKYGVCSVTIATSDGLPKNEDNAELPMTIRMRIGPEFSMDRNVGVTMIGPKLSALAWEITKEYADKVLLVQEEARLRARLEEIRDTLHPR